MKIKVTRQTHALYHYICDLNHQGHQLRHMNLSQSHNPDHPAYYLHLPAIEIQSKTWRFVDQHVTIERDLNPAYAFLSPSHFTLRLMHALEPTTTCTIHVYFDSAVNFNGSILKTHRQSGIKSDEPLPLDVDDATIRILAQEGVQKVCELMQMKAQTYLDLTKQIETFDVQLQNHQHNMKRIKKNSAAHLAMLTCINDYIQVLEKRDRYRDDEMRDDWSYLLRLTEAIQTLHALPSPMEAVSTAPRVLKDDASKPRVSRTSPPIEASAVLTAVIDDQCHLTQQVERLRAFNPVVTMSDRIALSQARQQLEQDLLVYEWTHHKPEDQRFVEEIRQHLGHEPLDVSSLFTRSVFNGDLDGVRQLYESIDIKIDYIDLFEKLLRFIEEAGPKSPQLIQVADYFHQTCELYRAYLLFRMTHQMESLPIELANLSGVTTGHMTANLLARLYLNNRLDAFSLYLRHGLSPLGCHAYFGNIGFNAVQMIILSALYGPDVRPYVECLFAHGASIHTPKMLLPTTCYTIHLQQQNATSSSDIFRHLLTPKTNKAPKLKFKAKSTVEHLSSDQMALLDRISRYNNILEFSMHFCSSRHAEIVNYLSSICDLKTNAIALSQLLQQKSVLIALLPSRHGGCVIHRSEKDYHDAISRLESLSCAEEDRRAMTFTSSTDLEARLPLLVSALFFQAHETPCATFVHNKTMAIHVYPTPGYNNSQTAQSFAMAQAIHDNSQKQFAALSTEKQREHVDSLRRLAIESQLQGELRRTSTYYLSSIMALSWMDPLLLNDYKTLFAALFQYAKTSDQLESNKDGDVSVLDAISHNASYLYSRLPHVFQRELHSTKLMQYQSRLYTAEQTQFKKAASLGKA